MKLKWKKEPVKPTLYPKRETTSLLDTLLETYGGIIITLALIFAIILFVGIVFATVPPTESGLYYNHL